jgi:hypothetical protein
LLFSLAALCVLSARKCLAEFSLESLLEILMPSFDISSEVDMVALKNELILPVSRLPIVMILKALQPKLI